VKFLFLPVSIGAGLIAGILGRKLFEQAWGLIEEEEPPDAKHREIDFRRLVIALLIEGAIFRLVKGLTDHGARQGYARLTGSWPGDEAPEPE